MVRNNFIENKPYVQTNPRKKLHRIVDKSLVVIDESIITKLDIDVENTWFEEILLDDGILLKPSRFHN
jgi:hypothetical protein